MDAERWRLVAEDLALWAEANGLGGRAVLEAAVLKRQAEAVDPPRERPQCRSCPHPEHFGVCQRRGGGTAYACGCLRMPVLVEEASAALAAPRPRIFQATVARWDETKRQWGLMNRPDRGFGERGHFYDSLDELAAAWSVRLGKGGRDRHGFFVEVIPIALPPPAVGAQAARPAPEGLAARMRKALKEAVSPFSSASVDAALARCQAVLAAATPAAVDALDRAAARASAPEIHACSVDFKDVPSDTFDNVCGALGLSADHLSGDLNAITCRDCLRAIAAARGAP